MEIVVGAPGVLLECSVVSVDMQPTFDDLAGLNIPAQEAGVRVGDYDAGSALLQVAVKLLGLVHGKRDKGIVEVAGLRRSNTRRVEILELLQLVALHHREVAVLAVEDDIVDADCDGSRGCGYQRSAGGEGKNLSGVHVEEMTAS